MTTINLYKLLFENTVTGHEIEIPLSDSQANGLAKVLQKLGIDPNNVIEQQREASSDAANELEEAGKSKKVVEIEPKAIAMAKEFYAMGKENENWYFNASKTLSAGFPDEQERVLFSILLASTSVQNEIYTNFIEAGLLFNAIMQDAKENYDLLMRWIDEPTHSGMDQATASQSDFKTLHIYRQAIEAKVINLGAKLPNVARALQLYFQNQLTANVVRNQIASSVELQSDVPFDNKNPLIKRLKIANYALTLIDPTFASSKDNWFNVVVDTWMFRVFYPGAGKTEIASLFKSQVAYANVSKVVSSLAQEAGVSPHVMQAAIWIGIKKKVEGDQGGTSDYLAAIDKLLQDYGKFWKDIDKETVQLKSVIQRIDTGVAKDVIQRNRAETGRMRFGKAARDARAAKKAATAPVPVPAPVDVPAPIATPAAKPARAKAARKPVG